LFSCCFACVAASDIELRTNPSCRKRYERSADELIESSAVTPEDGRSFLGVLWGEAAAVFGESTDDVSRGVARQTRTSARTARWCTGSPCADGCTGSLMCVRRVVPPSRLQLRELRSSGGREVPLSSDSGGQVSERGTSALPSPGRPSPGHPSPARGTPVKPSPARGTPVKPSHVKPSPVKSPEGRLGARWDGCRRRLCWTWRRWIRARRRGD
jgi:hypothetical protein